MNEALEAKALATFAKQAPKGQRTIEDHYQHIDYKFNITTETGKQLTIALIVVRDQGLTLANLATLQAYKDRGYNYAYILAFNQENIFYCEISKVAGHVEDGTFKLNKDCLSIRSIG
jgi:hypothetical protein